MNTANLKFVKDLEIDELRKHRLLTLSYTEKLNVVDKLIIKYPKMNEILAKIEECKNSVDHSREPKCIFLSGKPRSGKTIIMEHYMKQYPDVETETATIKPILYCRVPCPAYTGALLSALIQAIGDPFYAKQQSTTVKRQKLENFLKKCKVQMIMLDEFQHLVDGNRQRVLMDSSDCFKLIISELRIPVLFAGLPHSEKIFIENNQLGDRVNNRYSIEPFAFNDKAFRIILHQFDLGIPLPNISGLAQPGTWERIYIATEGVMGYMKILLKESTKLALDFNTECINDEILFKAYSNKLYHHCSDNPFSPTFNLEKAIKAKLLN